MRLGKIGAALSIVLALASAMAAETPKVNDPQTGPGPLPFYKNAALPDPRDLIRFDDTPVRGQPIVELSELGSSQAAFPLYYGTKPAASSNSGGTAAHERSGTADLLLPTAPVPVDFNIATTTSSGEGFIDYQDYLQKREQATLASPATESPTTVVTASVPGSDTNTVSLNELKAPSPLEAIPLPPPPLPELPERYAAQPDLTLLRADFERLRGLCDTDDMASAITIYANMPNFGTNEEINQIRADAANLLILGLARLGNLPAARQIYDSLPARLPGFDATLAKARSIINLTTYYVRAERFNDAYAVLMDIGAIQNRSALNNELFRLMSRMIPYLDNAEETDKATEIYDLLFKEIKSPGTAALFADNARSFLKYYLHFIDNTDSPLRRRKRLDFLEHVFDSLEVMSGNGDIALLRKQLGRQLAERYAGDPGKIEYYTIED